MGTRDPETKKLLLLDAALSEFATHGVAGARVDRLARTAGISPGLVYSFYAGKDELFDAVFDRIVELTVSAVPMDADRIPEYAAQLYDLGRQHPEVGRFLTWYRLERGDDASPAAAASMAQKVVLIKDAQRRGTVTGDVPAAHLLALVLALANMWNGPGEDVLSLVPSSKRRRLVSDAVARLTEP